MEMHMGNPSRPHLQAYPAPVVGPGRDVTLQCSLPPDSCLQTMTFILHKEQHPKPIQSKTGKWTKFNFTLYSLRSQDTGNYSCTYNDTADSYRVSESSETLELWVTATLPKPSLSATPRHLVVSGGNVTLRCQGPIRGVRFALYNEGEERCVGIKEFTQDAAEFHFPHVNINVSGNYSCRYDLGPESNVSVSPSEILELMVQSKKDTLSRQPAQTKGKDSRTILIVLSCIFILFLVFLFLAIRNHQLIQIMTSHGQLPRRFPDDPCLSQQVCLSHNSGSPQKEYIQMNQWSQSETAVREDEDLQTITYIQLDKRILSETQKGVPSKPPLEPTLYDSVAIHCEAERNASLQTEMVAQCQGRSNNQN
ncbi:immunoglobulin superfamily member 1-like isoform X2 [Macrotis lagotis]